MTTRVILTDKIYNNPSAERKASLLARYTKYISQLIRGFAHTSIEIRKIRESDKRIELLIKGPEELFVKNLIQTELGTVREFGEIEKGDVLKGTLVNTGEVGFGLFADCGIMNPPTDIFLPLYTLREQLANGQKVSLKQIINAYDFIDHFPLFIKIKEINTAHYEIKGKIAQKSLTLFDKIIKEHIEGLFLCGETKKQFKNALIQKGHLQDIISITRYGFLEHLVLFKKGTNARGIISEIGNILEGCKFSVLNPKRIKTFIR
ncbi:MAG: hypothetical protein BAJALOKI1v1_1050005 [Promethearchaeota archaeon]|nr:MAG: hypothetical protein BAJALOKI1v1_1050005 [Candidatus Lokiarchaeota archaeon]